MSDNIIRLLSDSVANQIAAGEVVQRPASVVKELMENSIDAGADNIHVLVKDAGKLLVQIIDNGCGMNEIDARMCFERHATSKIQNSKDLFSIRTMGFRGEAMASIASISQMEMKTRTHEQQTGSHIILEGSEVKSQDMCQCPTGTSISVKNLFFNVPARRNFLKSNTIEMKHIYDEFHRVALAHPHVKFTFTENNTVKFSLDKGNMRQRIVQIFGATYQKKLVQVEQKTDYLSVYGFLIKPEFARKTRGEQFFFVNKRFIKSYYLHKVIADTYKPYIASDTHPGYFLFLDINPEEIDVNVHPTKTEIKFRNDHHVAAMLESSLKYAIGSFNIAPSIDFDVEQSIHLPLHDPNRPVKMPGITINPEYNPFNSASFKSGSTAKISFTDLLPDDNQSQQHISRSSLLQQKDLDFSNDVDAQQSNPTSGFLLAGNRYLITVVKSGVMLVDTLAARERIVFEKTLSTLNDAGLCASQQLLFPEAFELPEAETDIMLEIIPELDSIGFNISHLGKGSFSCSATPAEMDQNFSLLPFIESVIESYQCHLLDAKKEKNAAIALAVSKKMASKPPVFQCQEDMNNFIDLLFSNQMPDMSPSGNKIFFMLEYSEIAKMLQKS
jgi:DNA mismatch repair protein MutL